MGDSPHFRDRKHPAHGLKHEPGAPCIVFLTVCTKDRRPWLAAPLHHERLLEIWREAQAWRVGRYVLMPDHLHLFAGPGEPELPLDNWVRYWKSRFTYRSASPELQWQTDHWDTRLRSVDGYETKWEYVRNNPVRHGLVQSSEDWPFQGELHPLDW